MAQSIHWMEDELTSRCDVLVAPFDSPYLPVAHPEWFRVGDIVRVGNDDLYDTGEVDEYGNPIFRVRNEAVLVLDAKRMLVFRGYGANAPRFVPAGERVMILGAQV